MSGSSLARKNAVHDETTDFATAVGDEGPVTVAGGRTQWDVGGLVDDAARVLKAPAGVWAYEPAEMTVCVGAGTTLAELDAVLEPHGQMVPLDAPNPVAATVGGVLSVGQSGTRRRKFGPCRDLLLQATYVKASGEIIVVGGPTVKNVSGYDLCRLLVGSLGTLGLIGEMILRCVPRPVSSQWFTTTADPHAFGAALHDPSSILWDGQRTWVLLEGDPTDVEAQATACRLDTTDSGPDIPTVGRESLPPAELPGLTGSFIAEIGVGVVHRSERVAPRPASNPHLHAMLKKRLDPSGRLNPGRSVL